MRLHGEGGLRLDASVVAIGAFDGVHRGHQSVIRQAVATARALGVPAVVYTFDPPPKAVFAGARVLTPIEEKLRRMAGLGVHHAVVAGFDRAYASRPAASFLDELSALHPAEVRVGADFRFGAGRAGDVTMLRRHFHVSVVDSVRCESGEIISSTRIRNLIARGDTGLASHLLGDRCPPGRTGISEGATARASKSSSSAASDRTARRRYTSAGWPAANACLELQTTTRSA